VRGSLIDPYGAQTLSSLDDGHLEERHLPSELLVSNLRTRYGFSNFIHHSNPQDFTYIRSNRLERETNETTLSDFESFNSVKQRHLVWHP